jgi:hypothetical protein
MNYKAYAALVNGGEKQVSGLRVPCQIRLWAEQNRLAVADGQDGEARGPGGRAVMQSPLLRGTRRPGLAGRDARGASGGGATGADQAEVGGSTICGKSRSLALGLRRPL